MRYHFTEVCFAAVECCTNKDYSAVVCKSDWKAICDPCLAALAVPSDEHVVDGPSTASGKTMVGSVLG